MHHQKLVFLFDYYHFILYQQMSAPAGANKLKQIYKANPIFCLRVDIRILEWGGVLPAAFKEFCQGNGVTSKGVPMRKFYKLRRKMMQI